MLAQSDQAKDERGSQQVTCEWQAGVMHTETDQIWKGVHLILCTVKAYNVLLGGRQDIRLQTVCVNAAI